MEITPIKARGHRRCLREDGGSYPFPSESLLHNARNGLTPGAAGERGWIRSLSRGDLGHGDILDR